MKLYDRDILGTQNWKQSQADPFLAQKVAIFGKYSYVYNVDEIFNPHIPHMRIIRIIRIFRIRMASPSHDTPQKWWRHLWTAPNTLCTRAVGLKVLSFEKVTKSRKDLERILMLDFWYLL